jgi:YVTN family beta-propeller protein
VSVISVASGTVTSTIPVGSGPSGVAFTPDGSTAYVTTYGSNTVSVITVASRTVTSTIPVGTHPVGVAFTPDGSTAYVTNSGSNTVSVISVASGTVTSTIPVGPEPYRVAFTPDGSTAYVTNAGSNTVSVIDVNSTPPVFTADTPPTKATMRVAYSYTFTATGEPAPTFYVSSGALPAGLRLDSSTGVLAGTPTKAGKATFTVTATNGVSPAAVTSRITITVTKGKVR